MNDRLQQPFFSSSAQPPVRSKTNGFLPIKLSYAALALTALAIVVAALIVLS